MATSESPWPARVGRRKREGTNRERAEGGKKRGEEEGIGGRREKEERKRGKKKKERKKKEKGEVATWQVQIQGFQKLKICPQVPKFPF